MLATIREALRFVYRYFFSGIIRWIEDRETRLRDFVFATANDNDPDSVLRAIDSFCWNKRWMMHLGDEKRAHLEKALEDAGPLKTVLELGLYCGYSAVTISRYLAPGGRLYSVEPVPKHRSVATAILQKAGLSDRVTIIPGKACDVMDELAQRGLVFDLVFVDHHKSSYLSDLRLLEEKGLMREGTVVAADNIIIFNLKEYLHHVRGSGLYKSSVLHMAHVEYNKSIRDGLEVSVYAGDKNPTPLS